MNANTTIDPIEAPVVVISSHRPTPILAWLPFAVLALTVAAFACNAPAKLAAFLKGKSAPRPAVSTGLVPTYVNYPVPVESIWLRTPGHASTLIAHR